MASREQDFEIPVWRQPDGEPVSCLEKIKVLDETQLRDVLRQLVESLKNPYQGKSGT